MPLRGGGKPHHGFLPMNISKILITLGIVLVLLGLLWPLIQKLGLGRLPGDIVIERDGFRFYFPMVSAVLISVLVSLLLWWFRR